MNWTVYCMQTIEWKIIIKQNERNVLWKDGFNVLWFVIRKNQKRCDRTCQNHHFHFIFLIVFVCVNMCLFLTVWVKLVTLLDKWKFSNIKRCEIEKITIFKLQLKNGSLQRIKIATVEVATTTMKYAQIKFIEKWKELPFF